MDVEAAVPSAEMTARFRRWLAVLVGMVAVLAAVLSWVETDSGRKEERAFVNASRDAIDLFVGIAASSPRSQFERNAQRRSLVVQQEGSGRVTANENNTDSEAFDAAVAEANADERAGRRLLRMAQAMSGPPDEIPALDAAALTAVGSNQKRLEALAAAQNAAVDEADRYGTRQERSFFSLGLTASAAALLGLAGLMGAGRAGRISLGTATCGLLVAVVWTGVAFV